MRVGLPIGRNPADPRVSGLRSVSDILRLLLELVRVETELRSVFGDRAAGAVVEAARFGVDLDGDRHVRAVGVAEVGSNFVDQITEVTDCSYGVKFLSGVEAGWDTLWWRHSLTGAGASPAIFAFARTAVSTIGRIVHLLIELCSDTGGLHKHGSPTHADGDVFACLEAEVPVRFLVLGIGKCGGLLLPVHLGDTV